MQYWCDGHEERPSAEVTPRTNPDNMFFNQLLCYGGKHHIPPSKTEYNGQRIANVGVQLAVFNESVRVEQSWFGIIFWVVKHSPELNEGWATYMDSVIHSHTKCSMKWSSVSEFREHYVDRHLEVSHRNNSGTLWDGVSFIFVLLGDTMIDSQWNNDHPAHGL